MRREEIKQKMYPMIKNYFFASIIVNENATEQEEEDKKKQSLWLIAPYFTIYFSAYMINLLVWPLFLMERFCNIHFGVSKIIHVLRFNFTSNSCIDQFMTGRKQSNATNIEFVEEINGQTINLMIVGSISTAVLSLLSYFLIWKPTLQRCRPLAMFLPPLCLLCQCVLLSYAQTLQDTHTFRYVMIACVLLPCLHSNFQGVLLLMFKMSKENDDTKLKKHREISAIKIEGSYGMLFMSFLICGLVISFCFDMSYSVLFVLQFTMGLLCALYGYLLIPSNDMTCLTGVEKNESEENNNESDSETSSDEEQILMMRKSAKTQDDNGLLSQQGNLFSEAPMIFSEVSYRKEMFVILEISVFTIAIISDSTISGPYLLQSPFKLTLREYGFCIMAQGASKLFGIFIVQTIAYFSPCKHGTLVVLGAFNTILYYVFLGVVQEPYLVYGIMMLNIFGGTMFPAIASFININFTDTLETVLDISTISSLIVTVGFNGLEYYVYMKTRGVYPGTIFLMTSAVLLIGLVIAGGTYLSSTIKNRRKTKDYADKLLNDYQ